MLIQADAALIPFPDQTFHCVVTSPPYWGLRRYAGEQGRIWGGDPKCEHDFIERKYYTMRGASSQSSEAFSEAGQSNADRLKAARWMTDSICQKCGAWYGALGLEPTPELHIEHMVEIMREVKRVLRDDGCIWLNYGDCYAGGGRGGGREDAKQRTNKGSLELERGYQGIAQGNLMLMPHRVAIALQADGWIVRNDVVWWKRNPMPESVAGWRWEKSRTKIADQKILEQGRYEDEVAQGGAKRATINPDWLAEYEYGDDYVLRKGSWRHTRSHEFIFMLCKSMKYYSNGEAVREQTIGVGGKILGEGIGMAGIIEGSNFKNQLIHLLNYLRPKHESLIGTWPPSGISDTAISEVSLIFARSILDFLELENYIRLHSFDHEIGIQFAEYVSDLLGSYAPNIDYLIAACFAFAGGKMSAKEFIQQVQRLWFTHGDVKLSKESRALALRLEATEINSDGDTSFSVHYSSRVRKLLSLVHNEKYSVQHQPSQSGRNPRSVLDVPTHSYKGAHYATFPPNLIAPLIRASCPKRCCPECGAPWAPVVEKEVGVSKDCPKTQASHEARGGDGIPIGTVGKSGSGRTDGYTNVTDYRPTCSCGHDDHVPGICLDPFIGSGTTGAVARELGRRWVGLDISMEYLDQQAKVRALNWTPSKALDDLPLFKEFLDG